MLQIALNAPHGGRVGCRRARVPGLFRAAVALGVRALARDPHARWSAVAQATASVVRRVRHHARAVPGVVGAASARQRRGDRRGAALGCRRGWASPDRPHAGATAGNGPRVAASGAPARRGPSRVRDPAAFVALDVEVGAVAPAGSELGDAVGAMMLAVRAFQAAVRSWRPGGGVGPRSLADRWAAARPLAAAVVAPCGQADGATREWVASLARPRSCQAGVSRSPQPRLWRAINSGSEAVTDARRTATRSRPPSPFIASLFPPVPQALPGLLLLSYPPPMLATNDICVGHVGRSGVTSVA